MSRAARLDRTECAGPLDDRFGADQLFDPAGLDSLSHAFQGMLAQEL